MRGGQAALLAGLVAVAGAGGVAAFSALGPAAPTPALPTFRRWHHADRAAGVLPELLALMAEWDALGPFDLVVVEHGGVRWTEAEQRALAERGVSKAWSLAATPHGHRAGLDAAPWERDPRTGLWGPAWGAAAKFSTWGEFAEARGFTWGGRFRSIQDEPHVEIPGWETLPLADSGGVA